MTCGGRRSPELLLAAEHVLSYLYRNRDVGLRYEAGEKPIEGYTDSDWGVRHSTTGYVFMYNRDIIMNVKHDLPSAP